MIYFLKECNLPYIANVNLLKKYVLHIFNFTIIVHLYMCAYIVIVIIIVCVTGPHSGFAL